MTPRPHLATLIDDFRRHGAQSAIITHAGNRSRPCSWQQLAEQSARFAAELEGRGIRQGERVLIYGANSAEWVAAFFGCVLRGVLAVPLDAAGDKAFAQRVFSETQPRLVTGDPHLLEVFSGNELLAFNQFSSALPPPDYRPVDGLDRSTPLQIIFTSGTTSEPKGIVHTHGNVLASLDPIEAEMQKYLRYERIFHPLRFLHTLPLSHVFGQFMGLWIPPLLAAQVHYEQRLEAPRLLQLIRRERISMLAAVPRVLELMQSHLLTRYPDLPAQLLCAKGMPVWKRWWLFRRQHSLLGLKFWAFVCGGATVPAALENFWTTLGFALIQGYGMTETTALVTLNHPFKTAKGSIGKPLAGRELRIADDGEIEVRGDSIAGAIWQHGAMQKLASQGWLRTGDLAARDERGELIFSGRKGDVIVTAAGLNIHPQDIETALLTDPHVRAATVVGINQNGATQIAAVLIANGEPTQESGDAAIGNANKALAAHQQIRSWAWWPHPDFPRTSTGKTLRRLVAQWAAAQFANPDSPAATADPLLEVIASVPGATIPATEDYDALRLREDIHLDSLGMVELQSNLEMVFSTEIEDLAMQSAQTVGDLRKLVMPAAITAPASMTPVKTETPADGRDYPHWPWAASSRILRASFQDAIMRPLVWLLAYPDVKTMAEISSASPMILIANHVTAFDAPLILYALPKVLRRDTACAMAADMLLAWREGRVQKHRWTKPFSPLAYWLVTLLFNAFPLPRNAGFRRSFAHAGEALDRGFHVMIFPEGRRTRTGKLADFQPGIGLLAQESGVPVLPMYLAGINREQSLLAQRGHMEIRIGTPLSMQAGEDPKAFTERLQAAVETLAN
jgi:long-chain acyl-CoA synthetase